jgi:hypothetical protein
MKILSIISFISVVYAVSNGANEPIADNQLGMTAKDCALQYCEDKDGMALWLSLVQECNAKKANPYFTQIPEEKNECELQEKKKSMVFTPQQSGMICGMMSLIGFLMGYSFYDIEENKQIIHYQELPSRDIDS